MWRTRKASSTPRWPRAGVLSERESKKSSPPSISRSTRPGWPPRLTKPWHTPKRWATQVKLKIDSPDVIYKSDVGGVELNITNSASVREVFANILERTRQALPNRAGARRVGATDGRRRHARELMIGVVHDKLLWPGDHLLARAASPPKSSTTAALPCRR